MGRARGARNALLGLGLDEGDRVAWVEIYAATANAGLVMVPINFPLVGNEIRYLLEDARPRPSSCSMT